MIGCGQHIEEHADGSHFSDWDADNHSTAQHIRASITTSDLPVLFSYKAVLLKYNVIEAHELIKDTK